MNQDTKKSTFSTMLSLLATPWLLFVSTASALYLKNQTDLYNRYEVLYQFLVAAFVVFGIGVIVVLLAKKIKGFNSLLWAYYLLAPVYMIFQSGAAHFTGGRGALIRVARPRGRVFQRSRSSKEAAFSSSSRPAICF